MAAGSVCSTIIGVWINFHLLGPSIVCASRDKRFFLEVSQDINCPSLTEFWGNLLRRRLDFIDVLLRNIANMMMCFNTSAIDSLSLDFELVWFVLSWSASNMIPCTSLSALRGQHEDPMAGTTRRMLLTDSNIKLESGHLSTRLKIEVNSMNVDI